MALILDLTRLTAAYGPRLLAEAGHRVIRVEPATGDDVRRTGPYLAGAADLEHGSFHQYLNAGKESVTLDAATEDGAEALRVLAGRADCVVLSTPFAHDSEWFLDIAPGLSVVEVNDLGNELCAYARAGLLALTGHPDGQPVILGGHSALSVIGIYVAIASSSALACARLSERGQHVRVSAEQCLEAMVEQSVLTWHTTGKAPNRRGFRGAVTAVSGALPCADGYWMLSIPHEPKGWHALTEWIGDDELAADESLVEESGRQLRRDFILDRLTEWSKHHKKEYLVVEAQRRHIPASPVATVLDLAQDPQLIARGFLKRMNHPLFGDIVFPMGATASVNGSAVSPAPRLGQHNAAVLAEIGLSPAQIQAFVERSIA